MYAKTIITLAITIASILILVKLYRTFKEEIHFFATGKDNGFKISEIISLWKLAKETEVEEPISLYVSLNALNKAIATYLVDIKAQGIESNENVQNFISKLYRYRTKINIDHDNKKGLDSTKYLDKGQRLRIILPGNGVFKSTIVNNGYEIVISLPSQKNIFKVKGNDWVGREISVYLWRKDDANYVFDTRVTNSGVFNGQPVLYLAQTNELLRTQKRRSVRSECNLPATMFFLKGEVIDFNQIDDESTGFKCLLEDISEDGAMIRIGGQGKTDAQIKLQFHIGERLIMMYGIVRAVEYNPKFNQSRLHFESIHLDPEMKNKILSFVYNVLPQDEKDILEALTQTEEDMKQEEEIQQESLENHETQKTSHVEDSVQFVHPEQQNKPISIDDMAMEDVLE